MTPVKDTTTLKAGQTVMIARSTSYGVKHSVAVVEKVSPTGTCTVVSGQNRVVFNADGRLRGQAMSNAAVLKWIEV